MVAVLSARYLNFSIKMNRNQFRVEHMLLNFRFNFGWISQVINSGYYKCYESTSHLLHFACHFIFTPHVHLRIEVSNCQCCFIMKKQFFICVPENPSLCCKFPVLAMFFLFSFFYPAEWILQNRTYLKSKPKLLLLLLR